MWSLFTDHVEWWQNCLTEISVLVVGPGLTYWGDMLCIGPHRVDVSRRYRKRVFLAFDFLEERNRDV